MELLHLLFPLAAHAHPGHSGGLVDGLWHPLTGADHLLAALAIGMLAARSRRIWPLPTLFLLGITFGAAAGFNGFVVPSYDTGILLSLVVLGVGLFCTFEGESKFFLPLALGFGFLHGNAHGAEFDSALPILPYAAGFLFATLGLHLAGIAAVIGFERAFSEKGKLLLARSVGMACLVATVVLWRG